MRLRFWLCLAAVPPLISGCATFQRPERIGWNRVAWGMTRNDIRKLFPQAHDESFVVPYHPPLALFGFSGWNEHGCASAVEFFFTHGRLRTVSIEGITTTKDHDVACGSAWLRWLSSAWGPPVYSNDFRSPVFDSDAKGWRTASSDIVLDMPPEGGLTAIPPDITFQPHGFYKGFLSNRQADRNRP